MYTSYPSTVFGPSDFAIIGKSDTRPVGGFLSRAGTASLLMGGRTSSYGPGGSEDGSRSSGGNAEDDDVDLDTHLVLRDSNGLKLYIQMQRMYVTKPCTSPPPILKLIQLTISPPSDIPNSGMAYKLLLYSPYIMLNRTGLDLQYRAKSFLQSARLAAGQTATANGPLPRSPSNSQTSFSSSSSNPTSPAPFLFSYGPNTSETRNRAAVRVKGSGWSKPMSFEAVGSAFEVQLPREGTDGGEVRLAVDIKEGEGKVGFLHENWHYKRRGGRGGGGWLRN